MIAEPPADEASDFYYCWQPVEGWTFIMLNPYAVSIEQPKGLPGYEAAAVVLAEHNPDCWKAVQSGSNGVDYFAGLEEPQQRYVPFNGGLGEAQLEWLTREVRAARMRSDRIVVLSHLPMYQPAASAKTLMYDSDAALRVLHDEGAGHVVAVLAGHLHRGGYAVDERGVHHVTVQSPLNFEQCFGHVDVHQDRLELVGRGEMVSRTLKF